MADNNTEIEDAFLESARRHIKSLFDEARQATIELELPHDAMYDLIARPEIRDRMRAMKAAAAKIAEELGIPPEHKYLVMRAIWGTLRPGITGHTSQETTAQED